jgi:protein-S-isoprenylcysteine O-methyltransferase Ste14
MKRKPFDQRRHRRATERQLLGAILALLLVGGGGLIALLYGWEAALSALLCLVPGVIALLLLWGLLTLIERWTKGK